MIYKEFKLIDEISSDEFPLMDIVDAFIILNHEGILKGIDYEIVEKRFSQNCQSVQVLL